jgi:hypothetical protein
MALTIEREKDANGGTLHVEGTALFERFKITGDGVGGNADFKLAANRRVKQVKIQPGNVVVAGFATTLAPTAGVDVRVVVPSGLGASQYVFVNVELANQ